MSAETDERAPIACYLKPASGVPVAWGGTQCRGLTPPTTPLPRRRDDDGGGSITMYVESLTSALFDGEGMSCHQPAALHLTHPEPI
ncbi:hypothetical protein OG272_05750 [Streptomyces sp. NBC_00104]|uniref:hypothetical protein n=1 Tax=Streptomyces sp. NBC_00104 TaxID=2903621 RepID=UPI0032565F15